MQVSYGSSKSTHCGAIQEYGHTQLTSINRCILHSTLNIQTTTEHHGIEILTSVTTEVDLRVPARTHFKVPEPQTPHAEKNCWGGSSISKSELHRDSSYAPSPRHHRHRMQSSSNINLLLSPARISQHMNADAETSPNGSQLLRI